MTTKEIKDLIKILDDSNLAEFQVKNKEFELRIRSNKFFEGKNTSIVAQPMQMSAPVQMQQASTPALSQAPQAQNNEAGDNSDTKDTSNLIEIKSPMVGTFYRSSGPDKPVFTSVGDAIQEGSVVCIIEAMKLFNEIESEVSGKIVKVLVEDATPVEYDQVLFLVEP